MKDLDRPRIEVDFNEMVEHDVVLIAKNDERVDSSGETVRLHEGLRVYLYTPDADDQGQPTYLIASGIVERNHATGRSQHVKWRCRIDEWGELARTPFA